MTSPYSNLPRRAFWRPAVADRHIADFEEVAIGPFFHPEDKIATAGSCFAQHIGRNLRKRGVDYLDLEPAPSGCTPEEAHRHGFGIFSCRYIWTLAKREMPGSCSSGVGRPSSRENRSCPS